MAALSIGAMVSFGAGSSRAKRSALSAFHVPEADFFARVGTMMDSLTKDHFEKYVARNRAKLAKTSTQAKSPIALVRNHDDPKHRWVDGTPLNAFYIAGLAKLFPQAKFLHVLRNPIDVIKSLVKFDRAGGIPRATETACGEWERHVRACLLAELALGPEKVLRIYFDSIQKAPRETLGRCLEFVGEQFEQTCLLPLARRINSSRVRANEQVLSEEFLASAALRQALDVYESARENTYVAAASQDEAIAMMENKFAASWKHVPLFVGRRHTDGTVLKVTETLTSIFITSSPNPSTYGQPVALMATVFSASGTSQDAVTFMSGSSTLGIASLAGGAAAITTTALGAGTRCITAKYEGSPNFSASTSLVLNHVVGKAKSTVALTSTLNPSIVGQPVTFTATVAPEFSGIPGGKVTFRCEETTLGIATLSGGVATLTTTGLGTGTRSISAVYGGGPHFAGSTSAVLLQVMH